MSVSFEELAGSPAIRVTPEATVGVRRFKIAWSDWQAFARELVGIYRLTGNVFIFFPPLSFPSGPPNMIVQEIGVEPFPADKNTNTQGMSTPVADHNTYAYAVVTATYRTVYDIDNDSRNDLPSVPAGTILTYQAELGAETMTIADSVWNWNVAGDPKLEGDVSPGIVIPTGGHQLIWDRVALPPFSKIRELRGKVNSATFLGATAGTVLFLGARVSRQFQFLEEGGFWRVEYSFAENAKKLSNGTTEVGWNYFYRRTASGGEHWLEIEDADGRKPYQSASFDPLFQFGTT